MTMTDNPVAKPDTKPHALIASDRVEATVVRRSNGEKVGSIERLMIDKLSGKVAYAVLSFGGFLRLNEKAPAHPVGAAEIRPRGRRLRDRHHRRRARQGAGWRTLPMSSPCRHS